MFDALPLPPKYEAFANQLEAEPPLVREMVYYALAMLMVDTEKARETGRWAKDGKEIVVITTLDGERFEIQRPAISEYLEAELRRQLWDILESDRGSRR